MVSTSSQHTQRPSHAKWLHAATWVVRILLALAFIAAGVSKLAGVPAMVQMFDAIGFGQWFRFLTGFVEVSIAVLLLVPRTGFLGAVQAIFTMVGAVIVHLFLIGGSPVPAVVLGVLAAFVAWRLRPVRLASGH